MNITERHMDFLKEAKIIFKDQPHLTTWRDTDNTMIALLHSCEDQDLQDITIIEIGETVARFEGCLKKEKEISIDLVELEVGDLVETQRQHREDIDKFIIFLKITTGNVGKNKFIIQDTDGSMALLGNLNVWLPIAWLKRV